MSRKSSPKNNSKNNSLLRPDESSLINLLPTNVEAWLLKRGKLMKSWRPVYAKVNANTLCLYKSDGIDAEPARIVSLQDYEIKLRNDIKTPNSLCLAFELYHKNKKNYMFCIRDVKDKHLLNKFVDSLRESSEYKSVSLEDFEVITEVGSGAYGAVKLVRFHGENELLALKEIKKDLSANLPQQKWETDGDYFSRMEQKNAKNLNWVMGERSCLEYTGEHPYLISLRYAFQDEEAWYLVSEYVPGGDLFDHAFVQPNKSFDEGVVKLWMAELVCALEYLHSNNIIHRDLKLENLILDLEGHLHLADFGFARQLLPGALASRFCGTKYYVSPEMLIGKREYDRSVDYWSLGVVTYELLNGLPPFYSRNKDRLYAKIVQCGVRFRNEYLSSECRDFILELLKKKPSERLGYRKAHHDKCTRGSELRSHPWFDEIDWDKIEKRSLESLFKPKGPHVEEASANYQGPYSFNIRRGSLSSTDSVVKLKDDVVMRHLRSMSSTTSLPSLLSPTHTKKHAIISPGGAHYHGSFKPQLLTKAPHFIGFEFTYKPINNNDKDIESTTDTKKVSREGINSERNSRESTVSTTSEDSSMNDMNIGETLCVNTTTNPTSVRRKIKYVAAS